MAGPLGKLPFLLGFKIVHPDLPIPFGSSAIGNFHTIGRPARKIVAARVVRQLNPLLAGDVHQIKLVGTGFSGSVLAHPGEGQELAVRRPIWRDRVTLIGKALDVGAVRFHGVDLRQAGASADEGDLRASFTVPSWRHVGALIVR